jgi:hypothetical protein
MLFCTVTNVFITIGRTCGKIQSALSHIHSTSSEEETQKGRLKLGLQGLSGQVFGVVWLVQQEFVEKLGSGQ